MMPINQAKDTFRILTTDLLAVDYVSLMRILESRALEAGAFAVDFGDAQVVVLRRRDPAFARLTNCIDLFVPKSMTLVWGMNWRGAAMDSPIDPSIFMRRLLYQSAPDFRHYFIGETEECNNRLRERMLRRNPDIDLVGSFHGPCSTSGYLQPPEVHDIVIEDIRDKEPHFVWVGVGSGKQCAFIAGLKPKLRSGILLATGSAFDVNAGIQLEAPHFLQRHRLAWLYQLFTEPAHFLGTSVRYNTLLIFELLRSRGISQ
jgi:N-acetylglucosaminyldiphosphoundecaprenol N-acetyl-beta-D-mannosaminyltransferase